MIHLHIVHLSASVSVLLYLYLSMVCRNRWTEEASVDASSEVYLDEMPSLNEVVDKKLEARKAVHNLLVLRSPNQKARKTDRRKSRPRLVLLRQRHDKHAKTPPCPPGAS